MFLPVFAYFYQHHNVTHPLRCPPDDPRWPRLLSAVEQGQALVRERRFKEAKSILTVEIKSALANLNEAFDCSIGISSSFRILSLAYSTDFDLSKSNPAAFRRSQQIGLRLMHVAMNWLTHAFVIKGENDGRWIDESSWPLSIQEINDEQSFIQKSLLAEGPYGHTPRWPDAPYDYRDHNLRIGIVTMCDYPKDHVLPKYSISNKHLYAKRHGYEVIADNTRVDPTRPHAWGKIKLMERIMLEKRHDWLLWFDCDTYFMNFDVTLEHILYTFGGRRNTKTGEMELDPEFYFLIQEDHAMLNTGVFFMRVNDWSINALRRNYGDDSNPWINSPWWENAAFSDQLLGDLYLRIANEDAEEFAKTNSDDMTGIYGEHVVVSPQVVFNSYHPITSRIFLHDTWEAGKFALAFSGVTSGSSPSVAQHVYGTYYREMCILNSSTDECIDVTELSVHPWAK
jgi:galactosyl transferase GMA12/MNN10 family